jgi:winged helix-turn-helix protein
VTSTDTPVQIDTDKLMAFVFRAVEEVGATLNCALVVMGGQLGYYRDLASHGPATAAGPAGRPPTGEPYAREWLNARAAGGFVGYDARARRYALPAEHAVALTDETSPAFPRPVPDRARHRPGRTADHRDGAPRRGAGMAPAQPRCPPRMRAVLPARVHDQPHHLWLPAQDGVAGKLQRGAKVADVGCGHGASTVLMTQAYESDRPRRLAGQAQRTEEKP